MVKKTKLFLLESSMIKYTFFLKKKKKGSLSLCDTAVQIFGLVQFLINTVFVFFKSFKN